MLKVRDISHKRCYLYAFYRIEYKDGSLFVSVEENYIEISQIEVNKKGQGTGTEMLQETLVFLCEIWPNKTIYLTCYTERLNWYKRLGFIVVKVYIEKEGLHHLVYDHDLILRNKK